MPSLFRQRRYFYYLSGVNEADCYLTYDIEKDYLILYIPKSDLQQAIWYGPLMDVTEAGHR
jgi:Xaa-Pro dipeptidase